MCLQLIWFWANDNGNVLYNLLIKTLVEIPRHTSCSGADNRRPKKYESPYDVVYDEEELTIQRAHAGSNNDSGISVMNNHFASSLVIR